MIDCLRVYGWGARSLPALALAFCRAFPQLQRHSRLRLRSDWKSPTDQVHGLRDVLPWAVKMEPSSSTVEAWWPVSIGVANDRTCLAAAAPAGCWTLTEPHAPERAFPLPRSQ